MKASSFLQLTADQIAGDPKLFIRTAMARAHHFQPAGDTAHSNLIDMQRARKFVEEARPSDAIPCFWDMMAGLTQRTRLSLIRKATHAALAAGD